MYIKSVRGLRNIHSCGYTSQLHILIVARGGGVSELLASLGIDLIMAALFCKYVDKTWG